MHRHSKHYGEERLICLFIFLGGQLKYLLIVKAAVTSVGKVVAGKQMVKAILAAHLILVPHTAHGGYHHA